MKHSVRNLLLGLGLLSTLNLQPSTCSAQGTAFTYQGRLNAGVDPAQGSYELRFRVYDGEITGHVIGWPATNSAVSVSNGLFTVLVDIGPEILLPGERWLEVGLRPQGDPGDFAVLAPRQRMAPAPQAHVAYSVAPTGVSGSFFNPVAFSNPENYFEGVFTGNGGALTNVNAVTLGGLAPTNIWRLSGNTGLDPDGQFLGSTDAQPVRLRVNNQRALSLEPGAYSEYDTAPNLIGGHAANGVGTNVWGAVIAGGGGSDTPTAPTLSNRVDAAFGVIGGGTDNFVESGATHAVIAGGFQQSIGVNNYFASIGGGRGHRIAAQSYGAVVGGGDRNAIGSSAYLANIGGGAGNLIGDQSAQSTIGGGTVNQMQELVIDGIIGGGRDNFILPEVQSPTIGGGFNNGIYYRSMYSTIAGGTQNYILDQTENAVISGGARNQIGVLATNAVIAGGRGNEIGTGASEATIAGGTGNRVGDFALGAAVSGGRGNRAAGEDATVAGGQSNAALARLTFAAGQKAEALHEGSFVWADATPLPFASKGMNQFSVRATGGFRFVTQVVPENYVVVTNVEITKTGPVPSGTPNAVPEIACYTFGAFGAGSQVPCSTIAPLYAVTNWYVYTLQPPTLTTNYTSYQEWGVKLESGSGTWASLSDRRAKENFAPVDSRAVLEKVAALPLQTWNYRSQSAESKHLGPVAQDFHAAFGLGTDNTTIATVDADGVALAAIQGLNQKLEARSQKLEAENAELKARLEKLEQLLNARNRGAQ